MNFLLVGLLINYSNYFSWARGRLYFKRNSVEFSVEFRELEYFQWTTYVRGRIWRDITFTPPRLYGMSI